MCGKVSTFKMKTKSTILAKKLAERIKKEFNIELNPLIHRTYAGYWQRKRGAWLWFMCETNSTRTVGSPHPATEVSKAKRLSLYDYTGHPEILIED